MNPFKESSKSVESFYESWDKMYPYPYNKREVDAYTKARIILMNGTEFEANWFSHTAARRSESRELCRELALVRECEKQQQLKLALLKPANESILEHTIGYEQLAVDLTAELARKERDCSVKRALDFALLEDFDHLYRYADLLEMEQGIAAEYLVGRYTEIMPGRPTIAHHRCPSDNVRRSINTKTADTATVLHTMIITAAEQQTMNYYMNATPFACTDIARRLYQEIALVEEEHVTHYESLMDPEASTLEMLLWHEYCECYLYWSCLLTESDMRIKRIWEESLAAEISHLHKAEELLKKYEGKEACEVIRDQEFPDPISLHENIDYVREILATTVQFTTVECPAEMGGCCAGEEYKRISELSEDANFFKFQNICQPTAEITPSHKVIVDYLRRHRKDYRYETAPNPIEALRDRKSDNTEVGRVKNAAKSSGFKCN